MISRKMIQDITNRLVKAYDPLEIYLFGSYAWGTPDEESDIDLLVVVETSNEKKYKRPITGYEALLDTNVSNEIIVYTKDEFEKNKDNITSFVYKIQKDGKQLYAKALESIEKLIIKYKATLKALTALKEGIDDYQKIVYANDESTEKGQRVIRTYRNSMVKLFEICFYIVWKYVKLYLWSIHGIELNSPKSIFREAFKTQLITKEETETLLNMVDSRNRLTHTYNENVATKIAQHIPGYYKLMEKLVIDTKPTEKDLQQAKIKSP